MRHEDDEAADQLEENFENLIFASSVAGHSPGFYYKLYGDRFAHLPEEEGIEWETPRTEDDLKDFFELLSQLPPDEPQSLDSITFDMPQ